VLAECYRTCDLKAPDFNRGDEKSLASKTQVQDIQAWFFDKVGGWFYNPRTVKPCG